MRKILTLLITHHDRGWWRLRTTDKDHNAREYLYVMAALLSVARNLLDKETRNATLSNTADVPPPSSSAQG